MMGGRIVLLSVLHWFRRWHKHSVHRNHDHNLHAWFVYAGDHPVSDRWGLHLEGQWRRHDAGIRAQQLLLRPAINYQLSRAVALSAGYAYVTTHRYGEYPVQAPFPEHRIYQQATVQHKARRLDLSHRFRTEQRWLGQSTGHGFGRSDMALSEPVSVYGSSGGSLEEGSLGILSDGTKSFLTMLLRMEHGSSIRTARLPVSGAQSPKKPEWRPVTCCRRSCSVMPEFWN